MYNPLDQEKRSRKMDLNSMPPDRLLVKSNKTRNGSSTASLVWKSLRDKQVVLNKEFLAISLSVVFLKYRS